VNVLEDPEGEIPVDEGVSFDLRPFQIKTISLRLRAG
jgi:hypothetical protein